jgi:hypothetical protein
MSSTDDARMNELKYESLCVCVIFNLYISVCFKCNIYIYIYIYPLYHITYIVL